MAGNTHCNVFGNINSVYVLFETTRAKRKKKMNNDKTWSNSMKILLIFVILVVNSAYINAINDDNIKERGIFPNSLLYKSEIILEKLSLILTFNPNAKVKKALVYGNERVVEADAMLNIGEFEYAERAILGSSDLVSNINRNIKQIRADNVEEEIIEILKVEEEVEEYRLDLEGLKNVVQITGETEWAEDISKIIEINRKELKGKLEDRKTKTIIKIKAVNGFNQSKAEEYLRNLEKKYNLDDKEKNRALKSLSRAEDYLLRAKDRLEIAHDRGFNTDNLADRMYKIEREIDNVTIEQEYEDARNIARKAGDIAISIISEKDGRKFEKEFVDRADKMLSEIRTIKEEDINRK